MPYCVDIGLPGRRPQRTTLTSSFAEEREDGLEYTTSISSLYFRILHKRNDALPRTACCTRRGLSIRGRGAQRGEVNSIALKKWTWTHTHSLCEERPHRIVGEPSQARNHELLLLLLRFSSILEDGSNARPVGTVGTGRRWRRRSGLRSPHMLLIDFIHWPGFHDSLCHQSDKFEEGVRNVDWKKSWVGHHFDAYCSCSVAACSYSGRPLNYSDSKPRKGQIKVAGGLTLLGMLMFASLRVAGGGIVLFVCYHTSFTGQVRR